MNARVTTLILILLLCASGASAELPHTIWLEAETFGPLHGGNFSYQHPQNTTKGFWAVAGPDVSAAWTQGGESEWMSIAARADEPGEVVCGRDTEAPAAGHYTLWVRYADYRLKKESFGVRIKQGGKTFSHVFGEHPVIDELDPMKLRWDFAFGWDKTPVDLEKGPLRVELYTTGPTEARRQVDCLCITTDEGYRPFGREKPDCAAWKVLRAARDAGMPDVTPLVSKSANWAVPREWSIASGPPVFLWNCSGTWLEELKRSRGERVEWPFTADPPIEKEFLADFRGKSLEVYGDALSGPAPHISTYSTVFADGSPFLQWLSDHKDRKFGMVLNYGQPSWPAKPDKKPVYENLRRLSDRFVGFVAGENLSYDSPDSTTMDKKIKAAQTRGEVLQALREAHDAATAAKYSDYFGTTISPREAWSKDIPCLSAGMESYAHAVAEWGVNRIGHENSGNSPTLARRLAFLRGAARQFGAHVCDYQSCNLGDSSTIFSRQASFFPASSRYVLDNNYDIYAGAGLNYVLKDYLMFWLAGADSFYHEEGNDIYWKPGGNSAGDEFPIGLSPRGQVTAAFMKVAAKHRIGPQLTPIAFLLDEAHGWSQELFSHAAFGLDRETNPKLLAPSAHEASIRGWFDVAYFPAPLTQNEPASAIRQTYVNGIFGDIFDVIVTAPSRTSVLKNYRVIIAAGQVPLSQQWGDALRDYVESGGTLVVCSDQLSGPGADALVPAAQGKPGEAWQLRWKLSSAEVESNLFRYHALPSEGASVLAEVDGKAIAVLKKQGKGQLITVGIPLGLGIDQRPTPVLALLMRHLVQGVLPIRVSGDVEWSINALEDGGWLVTILNNSGIIKPEHGINPTDYRQERTARITVPFSVGRSEEWFTDSAVEFKSADGKSASANLVVPAGAVRCLAIYPASR